MPKLNKEQIKRMEKYFKDKYGQEFVDCLKKPPTPEKEIEYAREALEFHKGQHRKDPEVKIVDGVELVGGRTWNEHRTCKFCEKFSFAVRDAYYLSVYQCCARCYIMKVEGRPGDKG